jgi:hypothetical protein
MTYKDPWKPAPANIRSVFWQIDPDRPAEQHIHTTLILSNNKNNNFLKTVFNFQKLQLRIQKRCTATTNTPAKKQ